MKRTRVAVLRGGPSEEYDISMRTGASVLSALSTPELKERFNPIDVLITKQGEWIVDGFLRAPEVVITSVDVVFLALHGQYGEDGTVQRLIEAHAVPYTGSASFQSRIAMNKAMTKDRLRESGVKMAPHMLVSRHSINTLDQLCSTIADMFGPEYIIKPVGSGSSVGVTIANNVVMLEQLLREAFKTYETILVEKKINGKEATCGVVDRFRGVGVYSLPVIEIVPPPRSAFFDKDVKYDGSTEEICPGRFSQKEKDEMEKVSKLAHTELGLNQYSRSDFMVGEDGVYFLEVNTLPGLTAESLFPKALTAVGSTYPEFINHLLTDALRRRGSQ